MSPTEAFTEFGVKVSPAWPTTTWMLAADAEEAAAMAARVEATVKRILKIFFLCWFV